MIARSSVRPRPNDPTSTKKLRNSGVGSFGYGKMHGSGYDTMHGSGSDEMHGSGSDEMHGEGIMDWLKKHPITKDVVLGGIEVTPGIRPYAQCQSCSVMLLALPFFGHY